MVKKILLSLLVAITLFVNTTSQTLAQTWYDQSFDEWYVKVFDTTTSPEREIFGERYTAAQVQWIIYSIASVFINFATGGNGAIVACAMAGSWNPTCTAQLQDMLTQNSTAPNQVLANAEDKNLFDYVFANPISPTRYVVDRVANLGDFNLIPEANAQTQGFGYQSLRPIIPLWRLFRNVTYAFFILFVIIMAFLVMFRVKISPQTAITVQIAIPKVLFGLIFVTFSYAIAGFLIDLMYVLLGILAWVVANSGLFVATNATTPISWQHAMSHLTDGPAGIGIFGWLAMYMWMFFLAFITIWFAMATEGVVGFFFAPLLLVLGFLLILVLLVVVFFIFFRFTWTVFKVFANFVIGVIFGPIYIGLGTIGIVPNTGLGPWMKNLIGNLLTYPVAGGLLYLSYYFVTWSIMYALENALGNLNDLANWLTGIGVPVAQPAPGVAPTAFWNPPLTVGTGDFALPLLFLTTSLVIMFMVPKVVDIIQSVMSGKPFGFGSAVGEAFTSTIQTGQYLQRGGAAVGNVAARARARFGGTPPPPPTP